MDVNNISIDINNDANEDDTNINIQKSNKTNINEGTNRANVSKNKVELKEVSGFGDIKIEKYGDALLKIINE